MTIEDPPDAIKDNINPILGNVSQISGQ